MKMKRRQFVKRMTGFVIGLFSASKICSELSECSDFPPTPLANPLKSDADKGKWHHFVYNKVSNLEEIYVDGKEVSLVFTAVFCDVLSSDISDKNCEIKDYHFDKVGDIVEQEFWFRNSNLTA